MRTLLIALLFPCAALAQQPPTVPADYHTEVVNALRAGRDAAASRDADEIAGLKLLLKRAQDEAKKAAESCKPKDEKK